MTMIATRIAGRDCWDRGHLSVIVKSRDVRGPSNGIYSRFAAALLSLVGLAAIGTIPAAAGDLAQREILGFSEDGGRFAFEEHGVYDASGYPYASIYVVDTRTDQWVAGTPIRIRLEQEGASEAVARAKAAKAAAPFLQGIKPRGFLLASNPPTETGADPHLIRFRNNPAVPPHETGLSSEYELRLDEVPGGQNKYVDVELRGFRLVLKQIAASAGVSVPGYELTLHEDKTLPASRERAFGYRLTDVLLYRKTLVVLVLTNSYGFETPDGRYLAVTRHCEASDDARLECQD